MQIQRSELNGNNYIRKFFAIILLAVFALSITPTKYLHRLFANHKDFISKTSTASNNPQFNLSGINCHCESNVVIAPYTPGDILKIESCVSLFSGYTITAIHTIIFSESISFGLRGPPTIG